MDKTRLTFDPASETSSSAHEVEMGCAYVFLVTADNEILLQTHVGEGGGFVSSGRLQPGAKL